MRRHLMAATFLAGAAAMWPHAMAADPPPACGVGLEPGPAAATLVKHWDAATVAPTDAKFKPESACLVARMHETGVGAAQDLRFALSLYKSAQAKVPVAKLKVATFTLEGLGGEKADPAKAFKLIKEVVDAKVGSPIEVPAKANYDLAILYERGQGVPQNFESAERHFLAAAKLGLPQAFKCLAEFHQAGRSAAPSLSTAYQWWILAAAYWPADQKPEEVRKKRDDVLASIRDPNVIKNAQAAADKFLVDNKLPPDPAIPTS